jgi:hypothetical protein
VLGPMPIAEGLICSFMLFFVSYINPDKYKC